MAEKLGSEIKNLTLPEGKYVLVLPGWYPTWLDPMPGDFNQRQIKAASLYMPQLVLYIAKDQTNQLSKPEVKYNQLTTNVAEIIIVYPKKKSKGWDVLHSNLIFLKLLYRYTNLIKAHWGAPALLHAYIVIRGGLGGWLLGKKWKLPFVLTEHWTIYNPADPGYLPSRNLLFQYIVKQVFKNAKMFLPVTENLKQQVLKLLPVLSSAVIPNVVDTEVFYYKEKPSIYPFRFIHVSTMIFQKNVEGLLRAYKSFNDQKPGTCLWIVGPHPAEILEYAKSIGLTDANVHFTGAVSYEKVAELLQESDALVLFSRYENLPCVILEALCCGVPVIATNVGGINEVVNNSNGLVVKTEHEEQLSNALHQMLAQYYLYNKAKISEAAIDRFSYKAVGSQVDTVYKQVLK